MKNIKKIKGIAISLVMGTGGGRTLSLSLSLSLAFALGLAFLLAAPGALAQANAKPTAVADSFGISSTHTRTVTLSGNVITGVAGTGLTTGAGATDIMLGADSDDGGVSNLRVSSIQIGTTFSSSEATRVFDVANSPSSKIDFISGQGSLAMNAMGEFTYTPPTGDFEFFFGVSPNRAKRAIAAGETATISATYRIADMASPAKTDDGVLTITVTAPLPTINFKANGFPTSLTAGEDVTVTFTRTGDDSASLVMGYQLNVGSKANTVKLTFAENSDEVELALDWDDDIASGAGGNLAVTILPSDDFALSFTPPFPGDYTVGTPNTMTVAIPAASNMAPTAVADAYIIGEDIDVANSGTQRAIPSSLTGTTNVITGDSNNVGADSDVDGMQADLRVTFYAGGEDIAAAITNNEHATAAATFNTNLNTSAVNGVSAGESPRMRMQMKTNGDFRLIMPADNSRYQALPSRQNATEKFSYRITDMGSPAETADGVLTITVTGANDAPTVVGSPPAVATGAPGGTYSQPLAGFFEDVDTGTTLTYALSGACTGFAIGGVDNGFLVGSNSGSIPSTVMTDTTCMVTATDGTATSPAASLAVVITANTANTAPVAVDDAYTISSDIDAANRGTKRVIFTAGNVITGDPNNSNAGADTDDGDASNLRVTHYGSGDDIADIINNDGAFTPLAEFTTLLDGVNAKIVGGVALQMQTDGAFRLIMPANDAYEALTAGQSLKHDFAYRIADMGSPAKTDNGVLTITITEINDAPVLVAKTSSDTDVVDTQLFENGRDPDEEMIADPTGIGGWTYTDADAGDTMLTADGANGGFIQATAGDGTSSPSWQSPDDSMNSGKGRSITGTYGTLFFKADGSWTYELDNECGDDAGDPGCATVALVNAQVEDDEFAFRVDDGSANTAGRYSEVVKLTIKIGGGSDRPTASPVAQTVAVNSYLRFAESDTAFGFADEDLSTNGNGMFWGVRIIELPDTTMGGGVLYNDGTAVTANDVIEVANLDDLVYVPAACTTLPTTTCTDEFTYQVIDNGNAQPNREGGGPRLHSETTTLSITIMAADATLPLVSIDTAKLPAAIGEGAAGMITFQRSGGDSSQPLLAYARVTSPDLADDIDIPIAFMSAETSKAVSVAIPVNSLTADATATVTLLPPKDVITEDPMPGIYRLGTGDAVSDTFMLTNAVPAANAIPTVTAVTGTATEGLNGAAGTSAIPNLLDNAADADTGDTLTVSRYTAGSDINMGAQTAGNNLAGTHGMLNITAAGVVTYTPNDSLGAGDVTDTFLFEVADNRGGRSTPATLTITVTGVNDSPVPPSGFNGDTSIVASATAGTPETVTVPAFTDPESATLTISHAVTLSGAAVTPAWLTVDSTGLVFTVSTPPATTTTGAYEVTVTATDGTSTPATVQFTITVTDSAAPTNAAPVVVGDGIDNMTITVGDAFNYAIMTGATGDFHDTDDATLTYALTSVNPAAPWMSLTTAGVFGGTAVAGTYTVTVTASDDETPTPASITDTFRLTVAPKPATNTKPVAPAIPSQTATVGAMFSFVVPVFTDADGDTLAYTVAGRPSWLDFDATTRTLSGTAAAGGPHTLTVTATDDGTPNLTSDPATFTLTVAPRPAAPMTPVEVQTGDTSPTTGGVVLNATAFGYVANDSRLTSITITALPNAATEGTLYLNGMAVAANTTVTRAQLDAGSLRFVPVSRMDSTTVMLGFTSDAQMTSDEITGGTVPILITGGLPEFAIGSVNINYARGQVEVVVRRVTEDVPRAATVRVRVCDETPDTDAAKNYVDDMGCPMPDDPTDSTDPHFNTAVHRVSFEMGVNTQTLRVDLVRTVGPGAMITATIATPGKAVPGMAIMADNYDVSTNPAMVSASKPIEANDTAMRNQHVEQAMSGFARSIGWDVVDTIRDRARGVSKGGSMQRSAIDLTGVVDYARMKTSGTSDLVDVDTLLRLARSAGRGDAEQVNAELVDIATEYLKGKASAEGGPVAYHETALETNEALAAYNDVPVGGLATDAAAIGDQTLATLGGQPVSAQAASGGSAADTRPDPSHSGHGGGFLNTLALEGVYFWSSLRQSNLSFNESGSDFRGDMMTLTLGIEKSLNDNKLLGVATSWMTGDIGFNNSLFDLSGKGELEQWSLTPYAVFATDYGRVWGTLGVGGGSLDYRDRHKRVSSTVGSSDVLTRLAAAGAEYDIARDDSLEVLGRIEGMTAWIHTTAGSGNLYSNQSVHVYGARGEFEIAWPGAFVGGGHYRPYLTMGYRWDDGDGVTGTAFEYGGGLEISTGDLLFNGSMRLDGLESDSDYDRESYAIDLTYDRGSDQRGLSLNVKNTRGSVASMDYFAQDMSWAQSASSGRSPDDDRTRTDFKAGYGIAVRGLLTGRGLLANSGEGVLTPFMKTNLDGSAASEWSMGLTLESGFGSIDLMHTTRPTSESRDQSETLLKFNFNF